MTENFLIRLLIPRWSSGHPPFLAHLAFRPCELLSSLFVRRLVEWSLDGPLSKLCPVIPTSNQDGRQAKNRKKGDDILKKSSPLKLLSQSQPNFAEMILGWSPSKIVSGISDSPTKMATTAKLNLTGPYGKFP